MILFPFWELLPFKGALYDRKKKSNNKSAFVDSVDLLKKPIFAIFEVLSIRFRKNKSTSSLLMMFSNISHALRDILAIPVFFTTNAEQRLYF
jgi:hypothetical protein